MLITSKDCQCFNESKCFADDVCSLKQNTKCLNSIGSFEWVSKTGFNETEDGNCKGLYKYNKSNQNKTK